MLSTIRSRNLMPVVVGLAAVLVLGGSIAAAAFLPQVVNQPVTAQATKEPNENANDNGAGKAAHVQRILERLGSAGINTTADQFNTLASKYGIGGAVRALAFAHAAGKSVGDITALFDSGKGWGQIRKELNLTIKPGIGWLLGQGQGNGHGNGNDKNKHSNDGSSDDGDDTSD